MLKEINKHKRLKSLMYVELTGAVIDDGLLGWHFCVRESLRDSLTTRGEVKIMTGQSGLGLGQVVDTCPSYQAAAALQFLLHNRMFLYMSRALWAYLRSVIRKETVNVTVCESSNLRTLEQTRGSEKTWTCTQYIHLVHVRVSVKSDSNFPDITWVIRGIQGNWILKS